MATKRTKKIPPRRSVFYIHGEEKKVKRSDIVMGEIARLIEADRCPEAMLMLAVIRQAVTDIANRDKSAAEAAEFLLGEDGAVLFSLLGIDHVAAIRTVSKWLDEEMSELKH